MSRFRIGGSSLNEVIEDEIDAVESAVYDDEVVRPVTAHVAMFRGFAGQMDDAEQFLDMVRNSAWEDFDEIEQ